MFYKVHNMLLLPIILKVKSEKPVIFTKSSFVEFLLQTDDR